MKITVSPSDPLSVAADVAVIGVQEGASLRAGVLGALSKKLGPSFAKTLRREEFTGKRDQSVELPSSPKVKAQGVLLVGLGGGELTDASVRLLAARGARYAQAKRAGSLTVAVDAVDGAERAAAEGVVLGAYRFTRYLTGERAPRFGLEKATLCVSGKVTKDQRDAADLGQRVAESVCLARDLINEPPNELYPEALAKFCQTVSKQRGLSCKVFDRPALEKHGMKLIIAVGQGSRRDPRLIHMTYTPPSAKGGKKGAAAPKPKRVVFVGKGLTFDSGGLCIKPAPGMEDMKGDMGGAANVVALMAAVSELRPDVEVHGIIGSAENMPDGAAYRPGDIFGSLDGKFVEIINTDAEGRLVLADALAYARELEPDLLLDNATLTGAAVVALGQLTSGFYSNRDELAEAMKDAAKATGESMWHMPLIEELRDGLKSDWADLKHTADRWGGSITAALFLREFIGNAPWIHVDIAGPSLATKSYGIYSKGGTGHGVLTYLKLIERFGAQA